MLNQNDRQEFGQGYDAATQTGEQSAPISDQHEFDKTRQRLKHK